MILKSHVNLPHLQIGDEVLLRNEKASKLESPWLGPYSVTEIDANGVNVELALNRLKRIKVHVNKLKKYRTKERNM